MSLTHAKIYQTQYIYIMNLYDKSFDKFKNNIEEIKDTSNIELMNYDNQKEKELLELLIKKYIETQSVNMLEELHRLCECEVIFDQIWSMDKNEFYRKVRAFDINSVIGSSFIHEFIKQIQLGQLDYFDDLMAICTIKYFKTPQKAEKYFDMLIERVKNIPGLDLTNTIKQKENFKNMFNKHKSLYVCNT